MARFIFIVLSAILYNSFGVATNSDDDSVESSEETAPKCKDNEVVDNCPVDCPSDYCPKSRYDDQSRCPKPDICPPAACKCGFNSRRAINGTCISTRDCPPFKCKGLHEEYNPCPSYCPGESCSQATPDGKCHLPGRIGIVVQCKPSCRCKKNYWRLDGVCVPYARCPKSNNITIATTMKPISKRTRTVASGKTKKPKTKTIPTPKCGDNEVVDNCPTDCPANYCPKNRHTNQSSCRKHTKCPPPRCKCRFNFRRADNGSCIPTRNCPAFECNRKNEEFDSCPSYCPGESCLEATSDGECHAKGKILIPVDCKPACRCKKNYWRLHGNCVPYDKCPKTNTTNITTEKPPETTQTSTESTENQITTVGPSLSCANNEIQVDCPDDCPSDYCPKSRNDGFLPCSKPAKCPPPACKCRFNSRRANNGSCINTRDCPPFACVGPYEMYDACPPYCPGEDCSQATPDGKCPIFGTILIVLECQPACRCQKNYWRLNGTCVPYNKCPNRNNTALTTEKSTTEVATETSTSTKATTVKPVLKCGPYETIDNCPVDCPINYCPKSEHDDFKPCPKPKKCPPPACRCGLDTHRLQNGSCVPTQECPPFECTRPNEEYRACYPESPGEDCSDAVQQEDGNSSEKYPLICKPACRCKKNYWRLDGVCVPYEQCKTSICPENEKQVLCKSACSESRCPRSEADTKPFACTANCLGPGCVCEQNYSRAFNGTCVPTKECPLFDCSVSPNQIYDPCPTSCVSDSCKVTPSEACVAPDVDEPCKPACKCVKGYKRNDSGICVPAKECDSCPKNENRVECKNACSDEYCPKSEADTKPRFCTQVCQGPGCVCRFNYRRAPNGTCISTRDCPPFDCSARPNEMFDPCPAYCPSEYCYDATPTGKCRFRIGTILQCNPKCRCIKGHWRNDSGICVPYNKCPQVCPPNEEYTSCVERLCRPQNCSDIADDQTSFDCEPDKVEGCKSGCVCKDGYLRSDNGSCVPEDVCGDSNPISCSGANEEYTDCKKINCPGDLCSALTSKIKCVDECCEPGCVCKTGYFRKTSDAPCIPVCDCPEMATAPDCQKKN